MSVVAEEAVGWRAQLSLGFRHDGRRTIISRREHNGPLVIQKPFYPEGETCHVYLLHPPGGVVGGDCLSLDVSLSDAAHALITTPAAGKFYRSNNVTASLQQVFHVAENATLEWLPQETILFDQCHVNLSTQVHLSQQAGFIGWEMLCLGRPASGEAYQSGRCLQHLSLWRDGTPLLLENSRLDGDSPMLTKRWGMQNRKVLGTLLAVGADKSMLQALQAEGIEVEQGLFTQTLLNDVLVCRVLAEQAEPARKAFIRAWRLLRPRLLDRQACEPRIWST